MNPTIAKALKEKGVAEKMIMHNDYASARDNLLRAQQLFPAIENIGSMLTVCDILSAASIKFPGFGIDYYWVLKLIPSCTLSAVSCRYQKLFCSLQPIRTFPGTKLALKHLQDAFAVLSDPKKRSEFDLKRGSSWEDYESFNVQVSSGQSISNKETVSTAQSSSECKRNSSSQISDGNNKPTEMLSKGVGTSVTVLPNCQGIDKQDGGVTFQEPGHLSADLNSGVIDLSTGSIDSLTTSQPTSLEGNLSSVLMQKRPRQDFYNFENDRKPEHFQAGQIWAAHYRESLHHNYRYARINANSKAEVCVTWLKPIPIAPSERRWCDAGLPVACGSFELNPEMCDKVSWPMISSFKCSWVRGVTEEQFEIYPKRGEIWALYRAWNLDDWSYNRDSVKGCKFELVEMISDFSKYLGAEAVCLVKVDGFKIIFARQTIGGNPVTFRIPPSNLYIFSHKVPAYRFKGGEIDKVVNGMFEFDQLALPDDMIQDTEIQNVAQGNISNLSTLTTPGEPTDLNPFPSNDPLKPSWSQNDFSTGQVWAVYYANDSVPRQYTRVNNVISRSQVCVTLLEPLPILDQEIDWKKENLPIVCGIFKVSGTSVNLEVSKFSHSVQCQQSPCKSFYKIYPLKGEIWAMYKNWNNKWRQSDHKSYQCQIVEILSGFEGDGITIARLGEVKGCLTFFQRQQYDGFDLTHAVSRAEVLSFSHRIPAFRVPGIGKYGIPESSLHLEPNALPPKHKD